MSEKAVKELDDFMCMCNSEGEAECVALMSRVREEFGRSVHPDAGILHEVVQSLAFGLGKEFYGSLDSFATDMWTMVTATVSKRNPETAKYEDFAYVTVQCDIVEHGIARIWELAKQAVKEVSPEPSHSGEDVTTRTSTP